MSLEPSVSPWTLGVDLAFLSSQELGRCPGGCPAPASWDSGLAPRAPLSFLWGLFPALPGCLVVWEVQPQWLGANS